jgi:predicted P-loop ATPase
MMPILVGPQGVLKSSAVKALAPIEGSYVTLSFDKPEVERARLMRGKLVCELEELKGLRTADLEAIKAWITRDAEEWTPKYIEYATRYKRRAVLIGTTNDTDFLADPTGSRRFLPIKVGRADVSKIERDRDQLWAEGIARFRASGVLWRPAQRLAAAEHRHYEPEDTWMDAIQEWLTTSRLQQVTSKEVLDKALHLEAGQVSKQHTRRVCDVLRKLGWEPRQIRSGRVTKRVWERV